MSEEITIEFASPLGPDLVDFESRNTKAFKCPLCSGAVLPPRIAILTEVQIALPTEASLGTNAHHAGESLRWYWKVDDMWKFDNIGFTKAVPGADGKPKNYKFVICGCCDKGIMGIQFIGTNDDNIYIGHNRVLYH